MVGTRPQPGVVPQTQLSQWSQLQCQAWHCPGARVRSCIYWLSYMTPSDHNTSNCCSNISWSRSFKAPAQPNKITPYFPYSVLINSSSDSWLQGTPSRPQITFVTFLHPLSWGVFFFNYKGGKKVDTRPRCSTSVPALPMPALDVKITLLPPYTSCIDPSLQFSYSHKHQLTCHYDSLISPMKTIIFLQWVTSVVSRYVSFYSLSISFPHLMIYRFWKKLCVKFAFTFKTQGKAAAPFP